MCAVLNAAEVEHSVVLECVKRDTVIAAARHPPYFELEPQRLRHPVRVGRQAGGDEFGDRRGDLVWQPIERTDSCWRQLDRPGCIPACHFCA
jgi:hypothetical protein